MGRTELLADVVEHVRRHGIGDTSLRELAEVIGTSHRMLLYHFGSREGLIAAVVGANEERERAMAVNSRLNHEQSAAALRRTWRRLSRPSQASEEKLFFELAAMAMYQRPGTENVADDMVNRWVDTAREAGADVADIRLDIAVIRGLLLDLLLTGDRRGTDAAFERFVNLRGVSATERHP